MSRHLFALPASYKGTSLSSYGPINKQVFDALESIDPIYLTVFDMSVNSYTLYDFQIEDDSISCKLLLLASTVTPISFHYKVKERELIIPLYCRLSNTDPTVLKIFPDYISNIVIPIHRDQFDIISVSDSHGSRIVA